MYFVRSFHCPNNCTLNQNSSKANRPIDEKPLGLVHGFQAYEYRFQFRFGIFILIHQLLAFSLPGILPSFQDLIFALHVSAEVDKVIDFLAQCLESVIAHLAVSLLTIWYSKRELILNARNALLALV